MSIEKARPGDPPRNKGRAAAVEETVKPRVRDRIFEAASELFYRNGIRGVGVDAIVCECGTNKMSFYRSFESKDALIAEYLRDQAQGFWDWWARATAPHEGHPRRQIEALFDSYLTDTCKKQPRGCAISNAAVEIPEEDHPGRQVALEYKSELRRRFRKLAKDSGARDPETLGDALLLLLEGSYLTRLTFERAGPMYAAATAARELLDAHGAR